MPITNEDRRAVRKIFRKIERDIAPLVQAEAERLKHHDPETLKTMTAQNAARCCIEVILNECLPYDARFLAELGVRMAAYLVTAAPIQSHAELIAVIQEALPRVVAEKVAKGATISTIWEQDGVERPNIPTSARRA